MLQPVADSILTGQGLLLLSDACKPAWALPLNRSTNHKSCSEGPPNCTEASAGVSASIE